MNDDRTASGKEFPIGKRNNGQGWLEVTETEPEYGRYVLVNDFGTVEIARRDDEGLGSRFYTKRGLSMEYGIRHWMELPEPPTAY